VPFAFVTGYGREGLPEGFQNAELLSKPFDPERLRAVAHRLLRQGAVPFPGTVSLFPRKA
jgi:hypothetical protein